MSDTIETLKVMPWGEGQGDYVLINKSDFDAAAHQLFDAPSAEIELGTDSVDQLSDEQLRAAIEAATGKAPHHKLGREKLIEQFNKLNAEHNARQDETAGNGVTRREIEADLAAMNVEFDPREPLDDLAALRDLHREQN